MLRILIGGVLIALLATAQTTEPPPPSYIEQAQVLDQIRQNVQNYTKGLPNYVCTQVTRRHKDSGRGWRDAGTVVEQLSFFEQRESYKVLMVDNRSVARQNLRHDQVGGATSTGEFGSMLGGIFAPKSETTFDWWRWEVVNQHWHYVLSFRTMQPVYSIRDRDSKRTVHVPIHGKIFADRDTHMVMRLHMECDGIPIDFPVRSASVDLEYDFVEIGGQRYLLPLRSDVRSGERKQRFWNEVAYRDYHKYGTESSVTFGDRD